MAASVDSASHLDAGHETLADIHHGGSQPPETQSIARLPGELLAIVFAAAVDSGTAPLRLTHVCSLWRAVAHGTSRLWRALTLHGDDARAAEMADHWAVLSRDSVRDLSVRSAAALAVYRRVCAAGLLRSVTSISYAIPAGVFLGAEDGPALAGAAHLSVRAGVLRFAATPPLAALRALRLDTSGVVLAGTAQVDSLTVLLQQCPLLEYLDVRRSETQSAIFPALGPTPQPARLPHLHTLELHGAAAFAPFVLALHIPALRALVLAPPAPRACLAALLRVSAAGTAVRSLALDLSWDSVRHAPRADGLLRALRAMPHLAALELRHGTGADGYTARLVEGLAHGLPELRELAFLDCSALDGASLGALVRARLSGESGETRILRKVLHACPLVDAASRAALAELVPDFVCSD